MARRTFGRKSFQDTLRANNRALAFMAAASGKTPIQSEVREKRKRVQRPGGQRSTIPLERQVLKAVYAFLHHHPRVAFVDRRQSGLLQSEDRMIRVGKPGILDLSGMMKGGRYFEIEVKRPGLFPTELQWKRIYMIRASGGIADTATSVEDAQRILST